MGENTLIQAVSPGESESRAAVVYQMFQNKLFKASTPVPALSTDKAEKAEKAEKPAAPEKVEEKQSLLPITNSDTFLKFMVDKKSNDITVYVVDRISNRVMRSIPPNDVNNLKAGDLLRLLA